MLFSFFLTVLHGDWTKNIFCHFQLLSFGTQEPHAGCQVHLFSLHNQPEAVGEDGLGEVNAAADDVTRGGDVSRSGGGKHLKELLRETEF